MRLLSKLGRALLAAVVTTLPVTVLAILVTRHIGPVVSVDRTLVVAATDVTRSQPGLFDALVTWQEALQPWRVYLATVPVLAYAWWQGLRTRALWALPTMLVGWNLGLDVKLVVRRARPEYTDPVSSAPGWSFPSGHVFNVTLACVCCVVLLWPLLRSRWQRVTAVTIAAALAVLTGFDRVFLGVHHPSDVIAGALLAAAVAFSSWAGFVGLPRRRTAPPG